MAENQETQAPLTLSDFSGAAAAGDVPQGQLPTEAQIQAEQVLTLANFQREKDSFLTNVREGLTLSGDRVAASPMTETATEMFFENLATTALTIPGFRGLSKVLRGNPNRPTGGFQNTVKGFVDDLAAQTYIAPKRYIAGGTVIPTIGSQAGRELALNISPDSEAAAFIGEFGGGLTLDLGYGLGKRGVEAVLNLKPMQPIVQGFRTARQSVTNLAQGTPMFDAGRRVRKRFMEAGLEMDDGLLADFNRARQADMLPGASELMTPAMRADSPELMQIEKQVIEHAQDTKLTNETARNLERLNQLVLDGFEFGNPQSYASFMQNRANYYQAQFDSLLEATAAESQDLINKIASLPLAEANANRIVFARLDHNLHAARETESELYDAIKQFARKTLDENGNPVINKDAILFDSKEFLAAYQRVRASANSIDKTAGASGAPAMPSIPALNKIFGQDIPAIGPDITIDEVQSILADLRQASRQARTGDNVNYRLAHFADELVEALGKTMNTQLETFPPEIADAISNATAFSSQFNQVFRNDTVATMFMRNSAGQDVFKPTEVLNTARLFDQKGARENLDDILEASRILDNGNVMAPGDVDPEVMKAVEEYLLFNMVSDNNFDIQAAQQFLNGNREILDSLPGLKSRLESAVEAGNVGQLRQESIKAAYEPAMNNATIYLNKNVASAVNDIVNSANPTRDMALSIRAAREDPTGNALLGLKQAMADYLLGNSMSGRLTIDGSQQFVDGVKLNMLMDKDEVAGLIGQLFDPDEVAHLNRIRATALRLTRREMMNTSNLSRIDDDLSSKILSGSVAGIGAMAGGQAGAFSFGGSLMLANRVSQVFESTFKNSVNNPTVRFLREAIFDEKKLDALFDLTDEGEITERAARTWANFAYGELVRVGTRPYVYNPLIHGVNPMDEKGPDERP